MNLDWRISQTGGSSWHYQYYFFGGGITGGGQIGATEVSHMSFDVSNNCGQAGANCVTNPNVALDGGFGNFNGIIGAFKLDEEPEEVLNYVSLSGATVTAFIYEFDSTRAPMWGDVCAKGGGGGGGGNQLCTDASDGNWLWNTGFSNHDSTSVTAFIAVPDTDGGSPPQGVPEPGVLSLLAAALVGAGFGRRRARLRAG